MDEQSTGSKEYVLNQLLYYILVESKTPLTAVTGYLHLLTNTEGHNLTEEQSKHINIIIQNIELLNNIHKAVCNQWVETHNANK